MQPDKPLPNVTGANLRVVVADVNDDDTGPRRRVEVYAQGLPTVDRTGWIMAWGLGNSASGKALSKRLVRAIESGKALYNFRICVDVHGRTYIQADSRVFGRHMNADLKRLGF